MAFGPDFCSQYVPKTKGVKKEETMKVVPIEEIPTTIMAVGPDELLTAYKKCRAMEKICDEQKGVGISAVQVGIPWKLFIIKTKGEYEHFVNCEYELIGDEKTTTIEGCLSLLNEEGEFRRFEMTRHLVVKVTGWKLIRDDGLTLETFCAYIHAEDQGVVFQHEIDHQQGPEGLISVKGKEVLIW